MVRIGIPVKDKPGFREITRNGTKFIERTGSRGGGSSARRRAREAEAKRQAELKRIKEEQEQRLAEIKALKKAQEAKKAMSQRERAIVEAREKIKQKAIRTGRGIPSSQVRRILAKAAGVSTGQVSRLLRSGQAKQRAINLGVKIEEKFGFENLQDKFSKELKALKSNFKITNGRTKNVTKQKKINIKQFNRKILGLSGGDKKRLRNEQEKLNRDVENFNKLVGNRQLSEANFNKAQKLSAQLDKRQSDIDKESSKKSILAKEFFTEKQLRDLITKGEKIEANVKEKLPERKKRLEKLLLQSAKTPQQKKIVKKIIKKKGNIIKEVKKIQKEFFIGLVPRTPGGVALTGATLGLGATVGAGGRVLARGGRLLKATKVGRKVRKIKVPKVIKKIPKKTKKKVGLVLRRGLEAQYLTASGIKIAREPTKEKRIQRAGKILGTEVIPFIVGSRLGVKGALRDEIKDEIRDAVKKLPPRKRQEFKEYMKQAELLGKYEPKTNNIKLNNIESIKSKKAQEEVRKFLKKNKEEVIVGGSVAQTGQINPGRKLGDMDLYLEGGLTPTQAAKKLEAQLKKAGVKRVSRIRGEVTIEGKKSIEFHDLERLMVNIKQVIPIWANPRKYIIKTPEGIKIQRLGLQARRKVIAAFADPRRFATGKYKKDLKDYKRIAEQIFKKGEKKARLKFLKKKGVVKKKVVKKKVVKKKVVKKKVVKKKVPSQKPVKKKSIPSQKPAKRIKRKVKGIPSQLPPKKVKKKVPIPPKKTIPSQPPVSPIKKKTPKTKKLRVGVRIPKKTKKKKKAVAGFIKRKKKKKKKIIKKKDRGYDTFARPLKKKGAKKIPKLLKVNKVPLKKQKAKDLRNYVADTSLSRTALIKSTKLKAKKPKIKVPSSYAKKTSAKFRKFRIFKGKKVPIRNIVIEKRGKALLDTKYERQGITLKKRIAQLQRKPRKKVTKKRKATKAQLLALKKGREKLKKMRKK
jgi:hypothetical protein